MSQVSTQAGFSYFWNVDFDWKLRRDMTLFLRCPRIFTLALTLFLVGAASFGKTTKTAKKRNTTKTAAYRNTQPDGRNKENNGSKRAASASRQGRFARKLRRVRYVSGGPWSEPTFADSTVGDSVDGEDLTVRRAAVEALGPYNGTVVVTDPQTGRILTIVNQKTAFSGGFQPCSTVKIYAALAD